MSLTAPGPVHAEWTRTLSVEFFSSSIVGGGKGRVTSDDGGIDCSYDTGAVSGDCIEVYVVTDVISSFQVTLTFTPAEHSYLCLDSGISCYENGSAQSVPYAFDRSVAADYTARPSFSLRWYPVRGNVFGTGVVGGNPYSCDTQETWDFCYEFKYGSTASLTAVPGADATFNGWMLAPCAGQGNPCTFTMTGPAVTNALFDQWMFNVEATSGGSACFSYPGMTTPFCVAGPDSFSTILADGKAMTVEAKPVSGWHFDHWGAGACAGKGRICTFTLSSHTTTKAYFAKNPTATPTPKPTPKPTPRPTPKPTPRPTVHPTPAPTLSPGATDAPATAAPSVAPTIDPGSSGGATATPELPPAPTGIDGPASQGPPSPSSGTGAVVDPAAAERAGIEPWLLIGLALLAVAVLALGFALGRRRAASRT